MPVTPEAAGSSPVDPATQAPFARLLSVLDGLRHIASSVAERDWARVPSTPPPKLLNP